MTVKYALLGLGLFFSSAAFAEDAKPDFVKCEGETDEKKKDKCNATEAKRVAKARSKSTLLKPSMLSEKFAALDDDAQNPFNQNSFYVGTIATGNKDADAILASVAKIDGAITMASYIGYLNKTGKGDEAKALATDLIPVLTKLGEEVKSIQESINKIKADPKALGADALKVVPALAPALATVVGAVTELPKAATALKPIAAGAGAAAVEAAKDKAGDAAKDAVGK
jgi:hypothetical protein